MTQSRLMLLALLILGASGGIAAAAPPESALSRIHRVMCLPND